MALSSADTTEPLLAQDNTVIRADYVPAADYLSPEFRRLENERLWPRVWQVACREEELKRIGDYVTYDIANESIIVVRSAENTISAYHNVCPHRGRQLTEGCGHTARFMCKFHGWKWSLQGENVEVVDREDWGTSLREDDVRLYKVHVGVWGGFVFINMADAPEPLDSYLRDVKARLDCYELDRMRYKWHKSIVFPCNWKVALEAFDEAYHVQTTHRQMLTWTDDRTYSEILGPHSTFHNHPDLRPLGAGSRRIGPPAADIRQPIIDFYEEMLTTVNSMFTQNETIAMRELTTRVGPDASPMEVLGAVLQISRESAEKSGAGYPDVTPEQMHRAGHDWHIFPNTVMLPLPTSVLCYRSRPYGNDPDHCIFEAYALERFAPGQEPLLHKEVTEDAADEKFWGLVLTQDFQNMGKVQQGMKSKVFKGARPNPLQEGAISNFHRALHEFLSTED
jgi:nitrite reductase/ring-hydroxylating ferredoxin subunit